MRNETVLRMLSGFVLVGVFAAGALFGAGLIRWTQHEADRLPLPPPGEPPGPGGPGERMRHELDLDAAQAKQLDAILASHDKDVQNAVRDAQGKLRDVLFAVEEELRPSLRPDQIEKLETWRKHRPPAPLPGMGPPGPPPPGMGPPPPGMGPPPEMRPPGGPR